jgi:ATP-dependent DNA helicase RecQ
VREARTREQHAMRRYLAGDGCRMEFLRRELDDPWAEPCGRCDNCAGPWYPTAVSDAARAAAGAAVGRAGVELEPRTMWPSGMEALGVTVKGRIAAAERAEPGRAVARLSDIGWGVRLRELLAPGEPDTEVPTRVVDAVVDVLKGWGWEQRPVAVVSMPARRRPRLVGSVAARIAEIGRLPLLGPLAHVHGGPAGARGGNSAHRLAAVWDRFAVPADVAERLRSLDGPVLLVDDVADTRWSLTVSARALRQAGATSVLPFVLALDA